MPPLTEYRSFSPNGDAQIVHMMPSATSPHPTATNTTTTITTTNTHARSGGPVITLPAAIQQQHHRRHVVASSSSSPSNTNNHRLNPYNVDSVSQWRRHKLSAPPPPPPPPRMRSREEQRDDDMDDATSFSSMRVVRDQDKPSQRKLSEWRNSVIRRKRQQLALAMATGQWDALSPSSRAASLLDEVGNQYSKRGGTMAANKKSSAARILPFIPDVLPKSERNSVVREAGSTTMMATGGGGGATVAVSSAKSREPLGSSYPLQRKDAKKRKEAAFSYFGSSCGGLGMGSTTMAASTSTEASGGKKENFDPSTMTSLAESLSLWSSSLSNCGARNTKSGGASKTSSNSSAASSILARLTCQESRQDENIVDTNTLRTATEGEEEDERNNNNNSKEGSHCGSSRSSKKNKKPSNQRSQVALEVVKLRKELKRLKHIVQSKKNKKEMREREAAFSCGTSGVPTADASTVAADDISARVAMPPAAPTGPHKATRLRFAEPLVTQVEYRPYTDPEDIEKLYFVEEELNELEWDRQTVADDQYEVVMASSASVTDVRIAHQKRRLLALQTQDQEGLPHSLSDLSVY